MTQIKTISINADLTGRTALVTGGAKRLGRAMALALARSGADVVINHRKSAGDAERLVAEITSMGRGAWAVRADLAEPDEVEELVERVIEMAGRFDILINNASIFPESRFATFTLDELVGSIKVDAWAPVVLGRHFAEKIGHGHIVNMLDTRVAGYDWLHVAYHSAKYLLGLFTREMAIRFAPEISVNAIAPGLILAPEGKDESYLETLKDRLPLKRVGSPEDIAEAALYLVASRYVTGQVIYVDGGRHLVEASVG